MKILGSTVRRGSSALTKSILRKKDVKVQSYGSKFHNRKAFPVQIYAKNFIEYCEYNDPENLNETDEGQQIFWDSRNEINDSEDVIVIPTTPEKVDREFIKTLDGGLLNEVFKSQYTCDPQDFEWVKAYKVIEQEYDSEVDYGSFKDAFMKILRILEEARSQREGIKEYEGAERSLKNIVEKKWENEEETDVFSDQCFRYIRDTYLSVHLDVDPPFDRYSDEAKNFVDQLLSNQLKDGLKLESPYESLKLSMKIVKKLQNIDDAIEEHNNQDFSGTFLHGFNEEEDGTRRPVIREEQSVDPAQDEAGVGYNPEYDGDVRPEIEYVDDEDNNVNASGSDSDNDDSVTDTDDSNDYDLSDSSDNDSSDNDSSDIEQSDLNQGQNVGSLNQDFSDQEENEEDEEGQGEIEEEQSETEEDDTFGLSDYDYQTPGGSFRNQIQYNEVDVEDDKLESLKSSDLGVDGITHTVTDLWEDKASMEEVPQGMVPFDTEADNIVKISERSGDLGELKRLVKKVKDDTLSIRHKMMNFLRGQRKSKIKRNLKRGSRLDSRSLARNSFKKNPKPYKKKVKTDRKDTVASIVIDESGSMNVTDARYLLVTFAVLFRQLNIPFEVIGFTSGTNGGNVMNKFFRENNITDYNEKRDLKDFWYDKFTRIQGCRFRIFREFDEAMNYNSLSKLTNTRSDYKTPLPDAVDFAGRRILKRDEDRKLMVVITDGEPNYQYHTKWRTKDYIKIMHNQVESLERGGVEPLFVGYKFKGVKRLPNALEIGTKKDFSRKMNQYIGNKLREQRNRR